MTVLGWLELPDEDQPPERIWCNHEELDEHFERVKARWKSGSGTEAIDDDGDLVQNELTKGLRR
jgi:hypothetical protein